MVAFARNFYSDSLFSFTSTRGGGANWKKKVIMGVIFCGKGVEKKEL